MDMIGYLEQSKARSRPRRVTSLAEPTGDHDNSTSRSESARSDVMESLAYSGMKTSNRLQTEAACLKRKH